MKKFLMLLTLLALSSAGLHAQTNTNSFVIPFGTNVIVQPAITVSSVTIQRVSFDFAAKRADIFVSAGGMIRHYVIQGAAFTAMIGTFQSQYGTPFAAYLRAHPLSQ
jgi:hypothetical protein